MARLFEMLIFLPTFDPDGVRLKLMTLGVRVPRVPYKTSKPEARFCICGSVVTRTNKGGGGKCFHSRPGRDHTPFSFRIMLKNAGVMPK